jgi:outer membrane protein assembly factor BamB
MPIFYVRNVSDNKLKAVDISRNYSEVSNQVIGTPTDLPPAAPQDLTATSGDGRVTLTWTASSEWDLAGYIMFRSQTANFTPQLSDSIATILKPEINYIDSSVTNGLTYYYKIKAFDQTGNISDTSNQAIGNPRDVTPPSTPQNLTATPGDQQVILRWSQNTESDLHKYNIYRDTSSPANTLIDSVVGSPPDTFYVDMAVVNNITYYYRITAVDIVGNESGFSNEVVTTPPNNCLADSPWPKYRGNARNTGQSSYVGPQTNRLKWSYQTGGPIGYSSPAIGSDGAVYVGSNDKKLYAIKSDGTFKWSYQTGDIIYSSPAIGSDGTVYVGSDNGKLYAINSDGTLKWSYLTGFDIYSSPAIGSDGTVYVGSDDGKLYAINSDGTLNWKYLTGNRIRSSPAIGSDVTLYVGSCDGKLYAFQDLDETDPTVALSSPSGGEVWYCESQKEIRWEASDNITVSNIALYYSIDNGLNYIPIDTTEVNDSSYTWTIPNTPSNKCKIKIVAKDGAGNTGTDISDGTFTIADTTKPSVQLISLNGGERLGVGLTDTIRFAVSDNVGVSYYKIFFSSDNRISYKLIDSLSSIQNSYIWNVPILFSNECLVKIIAADSSGNIGEDISDSAFEITDLTVPEVALLTPTGGEEYVGSLKYTIKWTASDNYKLALAYFSFSSDNGKTFSIFDSTNARDFTYNWIAPDIRSDSCRLRIVVKDSTGNSASDSTKAVFKVERGPTAFLTTPTTERSGDVIIKYQLWDKQRDALSFTSYYSIDSGENWSNATVAGDTSNIDSLHYDDFITWKSGIDIPHIDKNTIRFKILVSDTAIGMSGQTGDFHVDNNEVPVIDTLFTPTAEETGDIELHFIVADAENDTLNYCMQYSMDSGNHWEEPSISFDYYNIPAPKDTLSLVWHSDNDISNLDLNTVMFKVIPMDNDTGIFGQTGIFHVDNETGPLVVSRQPEIFGLWQDTIIIHFDRTIDTNSIVNNYEITSTKSGLITVNRSFSENHHSLFLFPTQPFAVNDIVTVNLYGTIQDASGNGLDGDADGDPEGSPTDDYSWNFTIPYLGDYNADEQVEIQDLIIFAEAWQNDPQDLSREIGPVVGDLPEFQLAPDNIIDFEDFVTLARMWNWSAGLGKIPALFNNNLGKMVSQPANTKSGKSDKYSDVSDLKAPMLTLNPLISDDPWRNSSGGGFNIEVKVNSADILKGSELILKYDPELLSFDGFYDDSKTSLSKANADLLGKISGAAEEMQSSLAINSEKLVLKYTKDGTVLLNIVQLAKNESIADDNSNILTLQFNVEKTGISDIEYFYSIYSDSARLVEQNRSQVQIDSKLLVPEAFAIYQNYPNPFNLATTIKYQVPIAAKVNICIYDLQGRLVNNLVDSQHNPGYYSVIWSGKNRKGQTLSSGMYFYQFRAKSENNSYLKTKKMLILK